MHFNGGFKNREKKKALRKERANLPPLVPYTIPLVGHTIQFGVQPVQLLMEGYKKVRVAHSLRFSGRTQKVLGAPLLRFRPLFASLRALFTF